MNRSKTTWILFGILILVASLYRVWDGRPYGFAPQIAMAIFAGAIFKNRKLAFILPLLSMLISDAIYQVLYMNGLTEIQGFYNGLWVNYLLLAGLVGFGFLMKKINTKNIIGFSVSGSVLFFLTSNFLVWAGGGGLGRPLTFEGLLLCYADGLAFFRDYGLVNGFAGNLVIGDLFFSLVLFGSYFLIRRPVLETQKI